MTQNNGDMATAHDGKVRMTAEDIDDWVGNSGIPTSAVIEANPSGIEPTEYRVLVLPKEKEKVTKGGIHIPDEAHEREQFAQMEGRIVAQSPLAFTYEESWPEGARIPQPGDWVLFGKYSGSVVTGKDEVKYRLISDKDVAAILT